MVVAKQIRGDAEQPWAGIRLARVVASPAGEGQGEGLDRQILGDVMSYAAAKEGKHRREVPFEELAELLGLLLAGSEDVRVGGNLQHRVLHLSVARSCPPGSEPGPPSPAGLGPSIRYDVAGPAPQGFPCSTT